MIQQSAIDVPRIDFSDSTNGALLLEPQRTNLIQYSEAFLAGWRKTATIVGANSIISADGTQNASLIQSTQTGSAFVAPNNLTLTIGNTYTFSCFAKKGNNDWIRLAHVTSGGTGCWFDLENGVVGTVNSESATIEDYGNGWYRCANTFIATAATDLNNAFIGLCDANGSTNAGIVGKNDYLWGAQLEQNSFSTSYIPTQGSAVTRLADVCNNSGSAQDFNSESGVLYAEIAALADDGTTRYIAISDGSNNERVQIIYSSNSDNIAMSVVSSNTSQASTTAITSQIQYSKLAISYKVNNCSFWLNGFKIHTDTSAVMPSGLNVLEYQRPNNTSHFYGKIKDLQVFTTALTDEQLAALTTI